MIVSIRKLFFIPLLLYPYLHLTDGACSFPSTLQDGTWQSSDMGAVTFNATHFESSTMFDFGALTFECMSKSGDRYFSVSNAFNYLSNDFRVALCFTLSKVNNYKYFYYPKRTVLDNTDTYRIMFQPDGYSFTASETCNKASVGKSQVRVLIKEGYHNVSSVTVDCPDGISGRYDYNLTGTLCTDTYMDVCTDKDEIYMNYTLCSDPIAFSAGGALSCVWKENVGDRYYTLAYNHDTTTDEITYFRVTCIVSEKIGDKFYVTTFPRACIENQNASAIDSPGIAFHMTANSRCVSSSDDTTSTLSAGAAAAIVIALLILLAAAAVIGIWYYINIYRKKKVNPDVIASKSPPIDTKEQERLDGRVSPFSPYPTVSELAVYRFGPSPGPEIDDDDGGMTLEATTPGFTDGRRTMFGKDAERESQASLPVYSEVGGETPEPTRLSEVHTRMSEISEVNIADTTPFTMTRATMNIPEESRVSPLQTPTDGKPNGEIQSPRDETL